MTHQNENSEHTAATGDLSPHTATKYRRFRRSRDERMIAGVCGGLAELFDVDAAIVRIVLVAATLLGFGVGLLLYLACWIVVPER
ncbi:MULTISPECIES: PspC domain-containing protein [Actinopolyspora]|uniref:Phage shock protein PspC (Stress-responsive transcriptional regulator) n=1 Tax=Actinopolyspora saharensis TaxID=995062 RepID=A0A1H1EY02_9ACTN|nr:MULTISPECIES: PspC domain-containing protein [Actinopolyspora]NHD18274.1 PspC domain-containing protein [Actinopolyspora sp. BKK2]NHE77047.1 PspC domain-containing protein [Actinopolyspora sp. BKK1]SDQ93543.1 Phage shock protein PspC (stress-responsive transcriptional regulator) [Actinopolyspora saharensis]